MYLNKFKKYKVGGIKKDDWLIYLFQEVSEEE